MEFRVDLKVEIDRVIDGLASATPVQMQLFYQRGRWLARSEEPLVATLFYDSMEEAIVAGAKEAAAELQATENSLH